VSNSATSVELRDAQREELALFIEMESHADSRQFVGQNSLREHQSQFGNNQYLYLTILDERKPAGFFLLVLCPDGRSVDFRRIVVSEKNSGIGKRAITLMEAHCLSQLQRSRVWLNVYDFNHRGIHVYEKLGYRYFKSEERDGKTLLSYEKNLQVCRRN
jgi:RimJ/RimL family protein N-acetyltransferase